mmetsp:Transcript_7251/g.17679  ORF Transcript_7251/g.17679 Transcript_7251/m.17679 type:complete len:410 (-) Transcript_7251:117-1346(-)|eukprot:CAMPEP_0197184694 /NCGR_PEP_ID=MMETSP1423-20130617/10342_1 /TAXON_ID=476441 /ORGANISM="Pseudo-nitzschia heimii, Strain UNC1101" /LENGTH=409 /DNA_ID=CAMNT_0042635575 /DNA_START=123 /DNA_END=1352 /DNA_ORIENTATION=+
MNHRNTRIAESWKAKEQRTLTPLSVPGASSAGSIRVVSGSGFRYVVPFPYRLHEMLSEIDSKHDSSIVSWLPDGKHFKVHDPRKFVEEVIPSAFKQKSLKSFQRQLHLYGFQRVHEGADKGAYYHENFLRDDRDLCLSITRTKAPKRSRATSSMPKKKNCRNLSVTNDNVLDKVASLNTNLSSSAIGQKTFDDISPFQQISLLPQPKCHMKVPQHKTSLFSKVSYDCASSSKCDNMSSSSTSCHEPVHGSFASQQFQARQPLDPSIADTCQWLINAGVPISAFDPVAIGDVSNSTFCVPQIVSSNTSASAFTPVNPKKSKISETTSANRCLSNEQGSADKIRTEPLEFHHGVANNEDINSLIFQTTQNPGVVPCAFQDNVSPFDNDDALLTDLLPGENLPAVDDSLWAL